MIFPFKKRNSFQDPFDPAAQIDREVCDRARRLIIGINLEADFRSISGALVVTEGKGKYLKLVRVSTCSEDVPTATYEFIKSLNCAEEPALPDLHAIQTDLCLLQQAIVERLKNDAGKYIDRLLVISLFDPGIKIGDPDAKAFAPIGNPTQLADSTGISVIDAFPLRDIYSGGTGTGLMALPAWLAFADRSPKVARKNRLVMIIQEDIELIFLPASDGLDVDIPKIQRVTVPGLSLLKTLTGKNNLSVLADANIDGRFDHEIAHDLFDAQWMIGEKKIDLPTLVRTIVVSIVRRCAEKITDLKAGQFLDQVILDCPDPLVGTFVNQLSRTIETDEIFSDFPNQGRPGHLNSILVAILGAMSIDQLPGNIPWITGADSQKILGRVSPGSPANWRQLLREMSDFQPPAMRLRDAI